MTPTTNEDLAEFGRECAATSDAYTDEPFTDPDDFARYWMNGAAGDYCRIHGVPRDEMWTALRSAYSYLPATLR